MLREAPPAEQVRIARDSYTYLHLPMVAGIVLFALGVKKTLGHIGDELDAVPAVALCGGAALYLVALSALKRRNIGSWNYPRLVAASALAVLAVVATAIPALLALGIVAGVVLRPDRLRDGRGTPTPRPGAARVDRSPLALAALCGAANSIIEGRSQRWPGGARIP